MWVSFKKMIFFLATKAQRHKAAQRQLSEPWCPGVFVAKDNLATKAQRHEAAQRKNISEPWCLLSSVHLWQNPVSAQRKNH